MTKENVEYQKHLEQLIKAFPDNELIRMRDAAKYLGLDARTFAKKFKMTNGTLISRVSLAVQLSLEKPNQ